MNPTPVTGKTATVYQALRVEILDCRLAPGVQIFEQDLAERFGVSKSPVREALLRLCQEDLVEVKARSGYRVAPISASQVNEMYEMRIMYETTCASLAVAHASDDDLRRLEACRVPAVDADIDAWIVANRRFHMALASLCGNGRLGRTAAEFIDQFTRFTRVSATRLRRTLPLEPLVDEHEQVLAALLARDAARAREVLAAHIDSARSRILDALSCQSIFRDFP
ncbi:Transcriptional regulator, GntR family [Rhodovulum sp. PH10]|uniref:GntR family transcriptional regulator n=1 Tax=Rhodovulum sp. PH10 TaxID=1187851 RepID=UPI00027C24E3|nr:GntR family transcriptional regulator [Rhodovulum sp. PH10]EJW12280.1 Transcriptional regulator, GntR family [Rhodovulum sp. PH10]